MSEAVLSVKNLTKHYGEYLAVDRISFDIEEGKILGLLGPNGAGKSTTIQMLLGLTEKDSGEISYFGKNFDHHREYCLTRLNFASTYAELNYRLTVRQNLHIYDGLYNIPRPQKRIQELLELLEITDCANKLFWYLSSGQKTRVILAKALINRPKMLLMDEPTASLDPDIVNKIIDLIKELQRKEKTTILFTSHNMEEVSRLCDQVAFLSQGKIIVTDTPIELTKKIGTVKLIIEFEGKKEDIDSYLEKKNYVYKVIRPQLIEIDTVESAVPEILFDLKKLGIWIVALSTKQASLEDVFLHISKNRVL